MTPNPHRLAALDAAIAACALDAMIGTAPPPPDAPRPDDAVPEATYDDLEIERRTWAYRRR